MCTKILVLPGKCHSSHRLTDYLKWETDSNKKCHKQKWCMLFFKCIKTVMHMLIHVDAIAHIKWRRLLWESYMEFRTYILVVVSAFFEVGSSQPNSTGSRIDVLRSSSNFYHLFVSKRKVFPENLSFNTQFSHTLW